MLFFYDYPADVISGRVKPEHLEGQLVVVVLNVVPNAHVCGQCSRISGRNDLCRTAEFILMEPPEGCQLGASTAVQYIHLNIPDSDNSVVTSVHALRRYDGLHAADQNEQQTDCSRGRFQECPFHFLSPHGTMKLAAFVFGEDACHNR
jgi:hypothetical protein